MEPLLILHGAIGSANQLQPIADHLKEEFIVHNMNFSGHGGLPLADSFSIERFASDVLKYFSENNIAKANIFGYSMGGYVALWLARHHPEKVNRIFTLATKFEWTPEIASREIKMLDPEKISNKIPAFAAALENRHAPSDWKEVLQKTAEMMISLGNENPLSRDDLNSIQQEVRIAVGDRDLMVSIEETVNAFREIPKASLSVLPETSHPIEKISANRLGRELTVFFKK